MVSVLDKESPKSEGKYSIFVVKMNIHVSAIRTLVKLYHHLGKYCFQILSSSFNKNTIEGVPAGKFTFFQVFPLLFITNIFSTNYEKDHSTILLSEYLNLYSSAPC